MLRHHVLSVFGFLYNGDPGAPAGGFAPKPLVTKDNVDSKLGVPSRFPGVCRPDKSPSLCPGFGDGHGQALKAPGVCEKYALGVRASSPVGSGISGKKSRGDGSVVVSVELREPSGAGGFRVVV